MKKRFLTMALALCMLLSLLPFGAAAADIVASGNCGKDGDNVTWTLDSNGLLTISGTGEIEQSPWEKAAVKTVIIKNGVTAVGSGVFNACKSLKQVVIEDGVVSIGRYAFAHCTALESVYIPKSIVKIDWDAFGRDAFEEQKSLTDVYYGSTEEAWNNLEILETGASIASDIRAADRIHFEVSSINEHIHLVTTAPTANKAGYQEYQCACGFSWGRKELTQDSTPANPTPTTRPDVPKPDPKPVSNPFTDVKNGDYFFDPVLWALNHDPQITDGMTDTTFAPEITCTRGQVVTFLWRAMGCEEPTRTDNPFTDVTSGDYFYKAVLWAVENGITDGTSATTFSPADPCTRAHVVTFLCRAEGNPKGGSNNPFNDVTRGEYYTDAVLWAVSKGITDGTSETTFSPADPCTRGQIVTFLYRDMK